MAVSNFPFATSWEVPSGTAFNAARWIGFNVSGDPDVLSQDLDTASDQRFVFGVSHQALAATGNDRHLPVVSTAGSKVVVEAAEDIAVGQPVSADGEGKAVVAQNGAYTLGFAMESVSADEYLTCFLLLTS